MAAKKGPKRRKTLKKVDRRHLNISALALGFLAFTVLSFFGLLYAKKKFLGEIPEGEITTSESNIPRLTKEADLFLESAFFKLGITREEVELKRVSPMTKGDAKWQFKEIEVRSSREIPQNIIKSTLLKTVTLEPEAKLGFKKIGETLVYDIRIHDLLTHRVRFLIPIPRPRQFAEEHPDKEKREERKKGKAKTPYLTHLSPSKSKTKVAIIVDDLGINKDTVDKILKIPVPLSFSILPNLPYSKYAAEKAYEKVLDVLLHLPMEPWDLDGANPGDNALLVSSTKEEISSRLNKSLSAVPHIKGINNHMGSRFTENRDLMRFVLQRIGEKGLFFIDSRTSALSIGFEVAKELGLKAAARDVFLDDVDSVLHSDGSQFKEQFEKLVKISKENGWAVGICHPYPETIENLAQAISEVKDEVEIVPISEVVY